jgi:hypothetical protein
MFDRAAHRGGPASDHDDGAGGRDSVMGGPERIAHLVGGRQLRATPKAVRHARGDHQDVVRLGLLHAFGVEHPDLARVEINAGQAAVQHPHAVEAPIAVVGDPIVERPLVRAGEPDTELLAAHMRRFGRHPDHVGVPGQVDRGEQTRIAESGDHHARAAHRN